MVSLSSMQTTAGAKASVVRDTRASNALRFTLRPSRSQPREVRRVP